MSNLKSQKLKVEESQKQSNSKLEGASVSSIANYLEIEYKYRGGWIKKEDFLSTCRRFKPIKYLKVRGPDTYYEHVNGSFLRWRLSDDLNELTIKHRTSKHSSLVREEIELDISNNTPKETIRFVKTLGYTKLFRIYKDCEIFWFKTKKGEVCVVYYTVECRGRRDRSFIEIEVEKGQEITLQEAKDLVKEWETKLGLKSQQRINATLLELYSNKTTNMLNSKYCAKCMEKKPLDDYFKSQLNTSNPVCKICANIDNMTEDRKSYRKDYESKNRDKINLQKRNHYRTNPLVKEKKRKYMRKRRATDINFKLKCNLRSRLYQAIRSEYKVGSAVKDLGCSIKEFREHIESLFYPHPETGEMMTWDTWGSGSGTWQLDHKQPLSSFDLQKTIDFEIACHYTNIQPLWHVDHVKKTKEDNK